MALLSPLASSEALKSGVYKRLLTLGTPKQDKAINTLQFLT